MNGDFYIHMMGLGESHQGTRTFAQSCHWKAKKREVF